jgi:hypothetical protein
MVLEVVMSEEEVRRSTLTSNMDISKKDSVMDIALDCTKRDSIMDVAKAEEKKV